MSVIEKIIAPKENADDTALVGELHFENKDKVSAGDELIELETSKTVIAIDTPVDGYVEYLVMFDETVNAGDVIINIHDSPESINDGNAKENETIQSKNISDSMVSRKAREFIVKKNIDVSNLNKTFIRLQDLSDEVKSPKMATGKRLSVLESDLETTIIPINTSKQIEISALSSVQSAGLVSTVFVNVDEENVPKSDNLPFTSGSYLPIISYEVSRLLKKFPILNSYFDDNSIRQYVDVNLGIALDIDDGLKVYTIKSSDSLTIEKLELAISEGIYGYFRKSLLPDQIKGSTFTITDLSSFGVDRFVPLINYKQSAVLGVSSVDTKLNRFTLCLSFDHRVTEGKVASQFLSELGTILSTDPSDKGDAGNESPLVS